MIWLVKLIFSSMKNCSIFLFELAKKFLRQDLRFQGNNFPNMSRKASFLRKKLNNFHCSFSVLNFAFFEASFVASMSKLACLFQVNSVQQFTASLRETSPQTMI